MIFQRQPLHLVALLLLVSGLWAASGIEGFLDGSYRGVDTTTWVLLAAGIAIAHQVYVWFCWRAQLHARLLTRLLGHAAFGSYALVFFFLIVGRFILIIDLAISNRDSLGVDPRLTNTLAILLAIPVVYLTYSVHRYFGFVRATGIDHFDPSYRTLPLVNKGIFRFTRNGMYTFGLLALWIPGLYWRSTAALAVALFGHLYIWVHYYCTEKPDMEHIYGGIKRKEGSTVSSEPA
jgi:protein-S-isoprenylcysteine O-methyltransferase Ste14